MEFTNIMSNWQNEGVAPSADLQANGFQAGQRPPASVFNWQWHRTSAAITELQEKLTGVAANAEVNQNAFSNVKVGSTTIAADSKTDTLTLEAGENITITPDASNDKVTIAAKDTVYTHPTYSSKSAGLYKVTVDGTGHVSNATAVTKSDITALGIPAQDTKYTLPVASSSSLGGVKAVAKTDEMTSSVGIDSNGLLWSEAGGGGGTAVVDYACGLSWGDVDSDIDTSIFSSYAVKDQAVLNVAQTLTDTQKAQARTNIGAGTITGVSANGTSVATSGVANIPAASTSAYGVTKLSSSTSSTSTTLAATASAVKSAYDLANGKAPTSHATSSTTYGAGSSSNYGHVKLSDSTSSTSGASSGIAATPKAVKSAYDLANTANTAASTAKTTADSASSTASAAQTTANAAQTTANAALPKSGGTMTGQLTAQNNTSYTTKQVRNIFLISDSASLPSGSNGDICLVYKS